MLDQWGNVVPDAPAVTYATSNPVLATLEADGRLLPRQDGTVEVIATLPTSALGLGRYLDRTPREVRYSVTLDLPPLLDGTWVARARGKRITRTDIVRAKAKGPEAYEVTRNILFTRGAEVEHYLARNTWTIVNGQVCEDNPVILPPDAPVSTLTQCSSIVGKEEGRVVLANPDVGAYELRRAVPEDFDTVHAVAIADLDRLRASQIAYRAAHGRFLTLGDETGARADARMGPRRFQVDGAAMTLGWKPRSCEKRVQCVADVGYWVESNGTSFTAHAFLDGDDDGVFAEFVATADQPARRVTDATVR